MPTYTRVTCGTCGWTLTVHDARRTGVSLMEAYDQHRQIAHPPVAWPWVPAAEMTRVKAYGTPATAHRREGY